MPLVPQPVAIAPLAAYSRTAQSHACTPGTQSTHMPPAASNAMALAMSDCEPPELYVTMPLVPQPVASVPLASYFRTAQSFSFGPGDPRNLHSFPTRRSSALAASKFPPPES